MEKNTNGCGPAALDQPPPEISAALRVLSGKWTILIIWQLIRRTARFNELKRAIPGITQHMLTMHLRGLETDGIVSRTIFAEVPPRVEYALTAHGRSLKPVIQALASWGSTHINSSQESTSTPSLPRPFTRSSA